NQTLTTLLMSAFARAQTPIDPAALVGGVFGLDTGAQQPLSETEKANVAPFLLLNQVLRPILASFAPASLVGQGVMQAAETVTSGGDQTASLHRRVAALETALQELRNKA